MVQRVAHYAEGRAWLKKLNGARRPDTFGQLHFGVISEISALK